MSTKATGREKIGLTWEQKFWQLADAEYDGHACIFSFTQSWRACLGTPDDNLHVYFINRPYAQTKEEACRLAIDWHSNRDDYPLVVGDICPKCKDGCLVCDNYPTLDCDNHDCGFSMLAKS